MNNFRTILACCVLAFTLLDSRGTEELLSLSQALRDGLKNHPDVLTADSDLRIKLAQALAVSEKINPRLETEFRSLTNEPVIELKLMTPIKRSYFGLRQHYVVVEQASAKADSQARLAGVLNDVYSRYVALWAVQEAQVVRRQNHEDLISLRDPIEQRIKAGQGNPFDLALLDAEIAAELAENGALEHQRFARSAALASRIGRTGDTVIRVGDPGGFPIPSGSKALEDFAVNRTPLRVALLKREEAACAQLAISRSDRFGQMEAGLLADYNSDSGNSTVGIGFSFELPLRNRNEAAIALAEAEVQSAQNDLAIIAPDRVTSIVRLRHKGALSAARSAAQYKNEVLPQFDKALGIAREALSKGQGDVGQIQIVINRITESRLRAFELQIDAYQARVELEEALGGRLEVALAASVKN